MTPTLDFRNVNSLWGSVLAETLVRCGVSHAVISPGSRSTPLTFALAAQRAIEAIPVLDERSAAFFALGLARQHRRPVVLVCTSGTAGANYFPAIIEAQESGVPLVVITADRPPEMRDSASGQTIDQQKLFGAHVNFYHELAVPEASVSRLSYLRQTVVHAVDRARLPSAGPVHLNAPFRDPLPPIDDVTTRALASEIGEEFFTHLIMPAPMVSQAVVWQRPTTARGIIVAGPAAVADPADYARRVGELAGRLGWPVLADALSPLRSFAAEGAVVVSTYDAILRQAALARDLTPRSVLCLGGWPTSKVLREWLQASTAEVLLVSPTITNRDALHGRTRQICAPVEALQVAGERVRDDSFLAAWRQAEQGARAWIDHAFDTESGRFEAKAGWLLARELPAGVPLFVASSMPVRDLEYFWPARDRQVTVAFNRGANGIDGTLSTALGWVHGRSGVLLTGDLALLHDANGFLLRDQLRGSLTIVLINNRGGGIFEHLPVASFDPPFEKFFATPQDVDFAALCAAHRVEHIAVRDWRHFTGLVAPLPAAGIRVLEVRTDRRADAARRKQWLAHAGQAAAQASQG